MVKVLCRSFADRHVAKALEAIVNTPENAALIDAEVRLRMTNFILYGITHPEIQQDESAPK